MGAELEMIQRFFYFIFCDFVDEDFVLRRIWVATFGSLEERVANFTKLIISIFGIFKSYGLRAFCQSFCDLVNFHRAAYVLIS